MKKENGITMMTLVVTVIIIFIISSVTLNIGIESYKTAKMQNFISKLRVIQGRVDEITEEYETSNEGDVTLNIERLKNDLNLEEMSEEKKIDAGKIMDNSEDVNDYFYFSSKDLENKLGLKDIDMEVIINFKTRKIYSLQGVKYNNQFYYGEFETSKEKLIQ